MSTLLSYRFWRGMLLATWMVVGWAQLATAQTHTLSVSPPFANAIGQPYDETPIVVAIVVSGSATMDLDYRVTWLPRNWFILDNSEGTVPAGGTATFEVIFNPFGLQTGTYTAQLNVENRTVFGDAVIVPITLLIGEAGIGSVMLLPDEDLEVSGPAGHFSGGDLQDSTLINASEQSVLWRVVVSENWVSVSPEGGELAPGGQSGATQSLEFRVNAAVNDLPAGSHVATVAFENISAGLPPVSFGELSTAIPVGTRLIRVVAKPVLTLTNDFEGGSIAVEPGDSVLGVAANGQFVFDKGQAVILSATAEPGFQFTGWISDVDEDLGVQSPLVISMDVSRTISAAFVPIRRALTISTTGPGAGTVSRVPDGAVEDNDLSALYEDDTKVTLSAQANPGSRFAGWEGNLAAGKELDNPVRVIMDRDRTIAARFESQITLQVSPVGGGTVDIDPDLTAYQPGAEVTLTALPEGEAVFLGWSGDAEGTETTLVVTLDESANIQALFGPEAGGGDPNSGGVELVVEIVGDGTVTPDGGAFESGGSVTLIATPGLGSKFVGWDQDAAGSDLTTTILMDGDRLVRAIFEASEVPALREGGGGGSGASSSMCGSLGMLGVPMLALGLVCLTQLAGRRRWESEG